MANKSAHTFSFAQASGAGGVSGPDELAEAAILWVGSPARQPSWLAALAGLPGAPPCFSDEDPSQKPDPRRHPIRLLVLDAADPALAERIRALRAEVPGFCLPVLVVGQAQKTCGEDRQRALAAGADDFVVEPQDAAGMAARLRVLLRLGSALSALAGQTTPSVSGQERVPPGDRAGARTAVSSRSLTIFPSGAALADPRPFESHVDSEWRRARRNGGALSVILLEAGFAPEAGSEDARLLTLSRLLRPVLRRGGDLLACLGPRRFAALLPEVDAAGAEAVVSGMRAAVLAADAQACPHFGVATSRPKSATPSDPQTFLRQAEEQLERSR